MSKLGRFFSEDKKVLRRSFQFLKDTQKEMHAVFSLYEIKKVCEMLTTFFLKYTNFFLIKLCLC